ncbi:MAG: hypothetical protein V1874_13295 [Spirochaetota bacterium]
MINSGLHLLIKDAFIDFRKKRFSESIAILEKIISFSPKDSYPYFLLCVNYLLSNRFGDADSMIRKVRAIDAKYLPLIHLEAFLILKSGPDTHSVLTAYIDKLNSCPNDKYLNRALRDLRGQKDFSIFQKNARLKDYVYIPGPNLTVKNFKSFYGKPLDQKIKKQVSKSRFNFLKIIIIILIIFLLAAAGGALYYFNIFKAVPIKHETKKQLPIDTIDIALLQYDLVDKILKVKPPVFYYSNDEIINDFNKAKHLIKNEKNNDAIVIINKIDNSNANYRVKEKNEFLRKFISGIEYKTYSDIPPDQVFRKPYLYRDSSIKWKGKIANIKRKNTSCTFNLLIDYKKDDIFKGIIDVYYEKDFKDIKNGDIVTLEGVLVNSIPSGNRLLLTADNIIK